MEVVKIYNPTTKQWFSSFGKIHFVHFTDSEITARTWSSIDKAYQFIQKMSQQQLDDLDGCVIQKYELKLTETISI